MKRWSRREWLVWSSGLGAALVSGCVSPGPAVPPPVAEGFYFLDSEAFYKNGLTRVTGDGRGGVNVTLLDHFGGGFQLKEAGNGQFTIARDRVNMEDVKRSLSGSGTLTPGGGFAGDCTVWINNIPGFSRDHRKQPWTLRPASAEETQRALGKLRKRYPGRLESMGL